MGRAPMTQPPAAIRALFQPRQQRPRDTNRAAHLGRDRNRRSADFLRADRQRAMLEFHLCAERFKDPHHEPRIAQFGTRRMTHVSP